MNVNWTLSPPSLQLWVAWLTNQFENRPKSNPLADKGQRTKGTHIITVAWSQVRTMSVVKGKVNELSIADSPACAQLDTPDYKQEHVQGSIVGRRKVMRGVASYDVLLARGLWHFEWLPCWGQQNRCTQGNEATRQAGKWHLPHCAAHCVALQSERRLGQRLHVIMTLAGGMQQTEKCSSHTQTDSCHMPHASTHNAHYNAWNWHNAAAGRIREVEVGWLCVCVYVYVSSPCLPPLTHLTNN